jgi:membrane associated rhomboid family serine protease
MGEDNGPVGLDSRDYMNDEEAGGSSGVAAIANLSSTTKLIIINVVVFLAWQLWPRSDVLDQHFMVSGEGVLDHWRFHTLITYSFSHKELWHLFWNMLFLHWFGGDLEQVYGRRNFAAIYLVAAIGGAVAQVAYNLNHEPPLRATPMLGASGSVMGIVVATTLFFPTRRIYIWGIVPCPLWALAAVYVGIDVLALAREAAGAPLPSRVGHAGHLGGAVFGALFKTLDLRPFRGHGEVAHQQRPWAWLATAWRRRRVRVLPPLREPPKAREEEVDDLPPPLEEQARRIDPELEAKVDDLLRKINAEGLDSLSADERAFLERASAQYRK